MMPGVRLRGGGNAARADIVCQSLDRKPTTGDWYFEESEFKKVICNDYLFTGIQPATGKIKTPQMNKSNRQKNAEDFTNTSTSVNKVWLELPAARKLLALPGSFFTD